MMSGHYIDKGKGAAFSSVSRCPRVVLGSCKGQAETTSLTPRFSQEACETKVYFAVMPIMVVSLLLVSCGPKGTRNEIAETRIVETSNAEEVISSPSAVPTASQPPSPDVGQPNPRFTWTAPDGWIAAPSTPMRIANFRVGSAQDTECYMSVMAGEAGGIEMNINRWYGQMGQDPLTKEQIDVLPKVKLLGADAPLVEIAGQYTGMIGAPQSGQMLLGTLGMSEGQSVFVKMVGPETTVRAERDRFIAFCASIK